MRNLIKLTIILFVSFSITGCLPEADNPLPDSNEVIQDDFPASITEIYIPNEIVPTTILKDSASVSPSDSPKLNIGQVEIEEIDKMFNELDSLYFDDNLDF
jgi:hypothetical protein